MTRRFRSRKCRFCWRDLGPNGGIDRTTTAMGVTYRGWGWYCGPSCLIEDLGDRVRSVVPDPRYHRRGDGWRGVRRWVRDRLVRA